MKKNITNMAIINVFIVTLVIFFTNCYAYGSENTSRFIPNDSLVYLNLDFNQENWDVLYKHKLLTDGQLFPPLKNMVDTIQKETGLNFDEQFINKTEQIGISVNLPDKIVPGEIPPVIGIFKFKDKEVPASILKEIVNLYESNGQKLTPSGNYKGNPLYNLIKSKDLNLYAAVVDSYIIASNSDKFMQKCIDVYSKTQKGLEDSADYIRIYNKAAVNKIGYLYFNIDAMVSNLLKSIPTLKDLAAFKSYKSVGIGLGIVNNGIEGKLYMIANPSDPYIKSVMNKSSDFNTTDLTPAKPYLYYSLTGLADIINAMTNSKLKINLTNDTGKKQVKEKTGIDLNIIYGIFSQTDEFGINCYEGTGQTKINEEFPNMTVFFKLNDTVKAENNLKQLKINIEDKKTATFGESVSYKDKKITVFNKIDNEKFPFKPAYIILENYLILGNSPDSIMKVIDLYDKSLPSLKSNPNFSDMSNRLGKTSLTSLAYTDMTEVVSMVNKFGKNSSKAKHLLDLLVLLKSMGMNSQNDGKDGLAGTLLIDIDWDKVNINQLFGISASK